MNGELYQNLFDYEYITEPVFERGAQDLIRQCIEEGFGRDGACRRCGCEAPRRGQLKCSTDACVNVRRRIQCPRSCQCANRRLDNREDHRDDVTIAPFGRKGYGLRTMAEIREGDFVLEYISQVRRKRDVEENMAYLIQSNVCREIVFDSSEQGNAGRYVNHSCSANMEVQEWIDGMNLRIMFVATRDIRTGEELTINYNWFLPRGEERMACLCGAHNCNGHIHQYDGSVRCPTCRMTLTSPQGLRSHEREVHPGPDVLEEIIRPFACVFPGCGKRYKRQGHLKNHAETHLPLQQREHHVCEFCGRVIIADRAIANHRCAANPNPPPRDDGRPRGGNSNAPVRPTPPPEENNPGPSRPRRNARQRRPRSPSPPVRNLRPRRNNSRR